jgi:Haloacid Dehalogenase superfamily, subfamily IB, phosphoserine phosphatase-like
MRTKLVCFDLDDTLIREVHSVMLPCILNGKGREHSVIQEKEEKGELNYIAADYLRAELLLGLDESKIGRSFLEIAKPLNNIAATIDFLHEHAIKSLVITVGPIQVAKVVSTIWGFDKYYGSQYETVDGKFTGKIVEYIKAESKINCLDDFCKKNGIEASECVAVGDGSTDIPLFKYCGKSIALNASDRAKKAATYFIDTDNLADILPYIFE